MVQQLPPLVIIGRLRDEYLITHDGKALPAHIGGPAAYAAIGASLWNDNVHLISRVWHSIPSGWNVQFIKQGIDVNDVKISPAYAADPVFLHQEPDGHIVDHHPAAHYLKFEHKLPKALIEYQSAQVGEDELEVLSSATIQPRDLHLRSVDRAGVHLTPGHYLTHATLPYRARELGAAFISLDPSPMYMNPSFRERVACLIQGLDAFLPDESCCRQFFQRESYDLHQMAEALSEMGTALVIIKCKDHQKILWDQTSQKRWLIPAYPSRRVTDIGSGDAFGGGFLAGMLLKGDPVEAVLHGNVSESITREGYGPWFSSGVHPQLAEMRLEALRARIHRI